MSILFTTGYLTQRGSEDGETYQLAIPNREIRKIFIDQKLRQDGLETILKYGIACNRKKCRVMLIN